MKIETIEAAVAELTNKIEPDTFIYDLQAAYGKPKASITRLKKGSFNLSKEPNEIVWKRNLLFKAVKASNDGPSKKTYVQGVTESSDAKSDLHVLIDSLRRSDAVSKHALRFVITTDWKTLLAADTKTGETLDIPIEDLRRHVKFFLPWSGLEKHAPQNENIADIKAAYKMAKLYDQICKDNPELLSKDTHVLNVFLSRLLFCFFAEDTEIFPNRGMFTSAIASHTNPDGTDLDSYLNRLFEVMNTEERIDCPAYLEDFPFVNGGLLAERLPAPKFSKQSRKTIIECGDLDWSEINPDIFGSMMQAVVRSEERTDMHYTSVPNIMKVIEPLFLNELRDTFENSLDNPKALERLRTRLSKIKFFDPACGSGNFLIIAFKELRKLEMEIFQRLRDLNPNYQTYFTLPQIQLTQFFGIEIDDFAHEIAILSMWLAEHQMNVKFKQNLGVVVPPLPLKPSGHIVCGNATQLDWQDICPNNKESEIYVLGNPPYCGARKQDVHQKADMKRVFEDREEYKDTDYVACWFLKGADYIRNANASLAFVATNSVSQGEQVAYIWPRILQSGLEIGFGHRSFLWTNNAKNNAGVSCVIIGLRNQSSAPKYLFSDDAFKKASNITPYLTTGKTTVVYPSEHPLNGLPIMVIGNMARDGGHLILTKEEKDRLLETNSDAAPFLRRFYGSNELIKGLERWCLWILDEKLEKAKQIPPIQTRITKVYQFRKASKAKTTNGYASIPHKFAQRCLKETNAIIVPSTSSERRDYIPIGFLDKGTVISNSANAIYDAEPYVFGLISSKMHMVWIQTIGGRMENRYRYSVAICYNPFPIPILSDKQKESITTHVFNVLGERENHPEKTMAQLYNPQKMPIGLKKAHSDLDQAVERCYRSKPFTTDEERLDYLFTLYEEITS